MGSVTAHPHPLEPTEGLAETLDTPYIRPHLVYSYFLVFSVIGGVWTYKLKFRGSYADPCPCVATGVTAGTVDTPYIRHMRY